jgi:methylphosphotriester-DNA--protein-cysteine methyltransferase
MTRPTRTYTLVAADGKPYASTEKGTIGGHRGTKVFGRLDCPTALRSIARGGYARRRVFFADVATAVEAGYRPCAACMPEAYRGWKVQPPRGELRPSGRPEPGGEGVAEPHGI